MRIKSNLLVIVLAVLLCHAGYTQTKDKPLASIKLKELRGLAKNALRLGDTYTALYYYVEWANRKPKDQNLMFQVAELYRYTRNYEQAEIWYKKLTKTSPRDYPLAVFYLARVQMAQAKYEDAKQNFLVFKKLVRYVNDIYYRDQYRKGLASCDFAMQMKDSANTAVLYHLNNTINKPHVEFSPVVVDEKTLIYGSLDIDSLEYYDIDLIDGMDIPLRQFYIAEKIDDEWKSQGVLPGPFNQDNAHIGNAALSPDGQTMYFTVCHKSWKNEVVCQMYYSKKQSDFWDEPVKMDESINMPGYTTTQPTVGIDPRTNSPVIYFVSNRPGGRGGRDIWYTEFNARKNVFKKPRNAGSKINSRGDEATPYYDLSTRTLYYSSNGKVGYGGYDVFSTFGEKRKWEPTTILGKGINTSYDDLDFTLNTDKSGGFMVSNRPGGTALLSETCCDDIYEFTFSKFIKIDLITHVTSNNKSLTNYDVSLYLTNPNTGEKLLISSDNITKETFQSNLDQGYTYTMEVSKKGYYSKSIEINTADIDVSTTINKTIDLEEIPKEPFVLKGVLYDFNSAKLTPGAKTTIDTTLLVLMTEKPYIIIQISSHTDHIGDDDFNMDLSNRRAKSVVKYLTSKGIDPARLRYKGYGETVPVAPNQNEDGSDNPEGRALNRRTEFTILSEEKPDNTLPDYDPDSDKKSKRKKKVEF